MKHCLEVEALPPPYAVGVLSETLQGFAFVYPSVPPPRELVGTAHTHCVTVTSLSIRTANCKDKSFLLYK